jgi:DNA-binding NarL/FixJ family response regulator
VVGSQSGYPATSRARRNAWPSGGNRAIAAGVVGRAEIAVADGRTATPAAGQLLLHPCAASQLVARLQAQTDGPGRLAGLSPRERATLELIGDGLTNRQIGDRLGVSEKTVKNYASTLFAKLGMKQRTQAAAYAARTFDGRATGMSQNMRMTARKP